jgi:hypothetical protein
VGTAGVILFAIGDKIFGPWQHELGSCERDGPELFDAPGEILQMPGGRVVVDNSFA